MSLLLDTHTLIWWLADQQVSDEARARIAEPSTRVVVSVASIWEAVIKSAIGKLELPEALAPAATEEGFELLSITAAHAEQVGELTLHHRDPFDRMLVAQAQLEGLTVVTRDRIFDLYPVSVRAADGAVGLDRRSGARRRTGRIGECACVRTGDSTSTPTRPRSGRRSRGSTATPAGGRGSGSSRRGGLVADEAWTCVVQPPLPYRLRFRLHLDEVVTERLAGRR